jgi:Tol biopolymer transport system component
MRPDGSELQQLTHTPEFSEAGVRFSPNGKGLLYYRMPRSVPLDNNTYGAQELIVVDGEYRNQIVLGKDHGWASWGPNGRLLACLSAKGIQIIDLASDRVVRELPRKGIVEQLTWSPDGKYLAGTANGLGQFWNIAQLSFETGEITCVSENDRFNCTPDWLPDSQHILYSRGIIPQAGGHAELWMASSDGKTRKMVYAEESRHIYGGCSSPDGQFVVFTRSTGDLGPVENAAAVMALIRLSDSPLVGDNREALKARFPEAKHGPRLDLPSGWEPHWTANTNAAELLTAALRTRSTSISK